MAKKLHVVCTSMVTLRSEDANKIFSMSGNVNCRYSLQLADGQGWELVATEEVEPWLNRLASIMQLSKCKPDGYPRLIFTRKTYETGQCTRSGDLVCGGWQAYDLRSLKLWAHCDVPDIICEMGNEENHDLDIIRMWLSLSPLYNRVLESEGLPLHAALIERNGAAVLLLAAGGTGKSTCCRRIPPPWKPLCDDLTLIVVNPRKQYQAHPFPTWSNYLWKTSKVTWDVQRYLPLSALFFLEQGSQDQVKPIGNGQASVLVTESTMQVYQSICRDGDEKEERRLKEKIFKNACKLAKKIPAFKLCVTMDGRFWEMMARELAG